MDRTSTPSTPTATTAFSPSPLDSALSEGTRVEIHNTKGTVRYVGETAFATGKWVGVELDEPNGKNNGTVQGKPYFQCKEAHGVFVRASQIKTVLGLNDEPDTPSRFASSSLHTPAPRSTLSTSVPTIARRTSPSGNIPRSQASNATSPLIPRSTSGNTGRISALGKTASGSSSNSSISTTKSDTSTASKPLAPEKLISSPRGSAPASPTRLSPSSTRSENAPEKVVTPITALPPTTPAARAVLHTSSLDSPSIPLRSEQMVSLKEHDELCTRFKVLEAKRLDDKERLKEYERFKIEAEQLSFAKTKLAAKVSELQLELRDAKKSLKDAQESQENFDDSHTDLLEQLEMMTLDKEMAEEKAESLQHEITMLKEKVEELSLDLEVYKDEDELAAGAGTSAVSDKPSVEAVQLARQNERLKEALVRLRDVTAEQEAELQKTIKSLEEDLSVLQGVAVAHEKLQSDYNIAENQIGDLKSQLDDALGAEDMVEELTEKNLQKSEKIEEMQAIIEDLEALKELNDELEEAHAETEKHLQDEIDQLNSVIRDLKVKLDASGETYADYENTMNQFRELVQTLQSDLEQLRHREENQPGETASLNSQSQAMLNLNMQLHSTVMKAQAKAIDLELRKLDATQAAEHLAFVKPYLPHTFFKNENDPLRCLLLLKRLAFKADLVVKHLDLGENIGDSTSVPKGDTEYIGAVFEAREKLVWLQTIATRFVAYMSTCSVEEFLKMGNVYHDLVGVERRLDGFLDLQRAEELKPLICVSDTQRALDHFEHLAGQYLRNTELPLVIPTVLGFVRTAEFCMDTTRFNLEGLARLASHLVQNPGEGALLSPESLNQELIEPLLDALKVSKSVKVQSRKIERRIHELRDQDLNADIACLTKSQAAFENAKMISKFCNEAYKCVFQYLKEKRDDGQEIQVSYIHQLLSNAASASFEMGGMTALDQVKAKLDALFEDCNGLYTLVMDPMNAKNANKIEEPWITRSKNLQSDVVVTADLEKRIQSYEEETKQLLTQIGQKDKYLQEGSVKIELLEKRMEIVKKQTEKIAKLESDLTKSTKQEKIYEEAIENLQTELETLEQENAQMKKLSRRSERQAGSVSSSRKSLSGSVEIDATEETEVITAATGAQTEHLRDAIRYLRAENCRLKANLSAQCLRELPSVEPPIKKENEQLTKTTAQAKSLLNDIWRASVSLKMVDLTARSRTDHKKWQTTTTLPDHQYQAQQAVMNTLSLRSNSIYDKLSLLQMSTKGILKNSPVTKKQSSIGRIQIPLPRPSSVDVSNPSLPLRRCVHFQTLAELRRVHQTFVM